ncbi:transporter gate domain protein [Mizugakiibacter sediminis]|uniref:Transporter gate domain protein n=1 Tax=Mizugakiibacter sediminis TaxID=1475481 RepID=A0A0K8QNI1_9GAMM|nr:transporter gate domain protein [Mizugakiibacter sediminis]
MLEAVEAQHRQHGVVVHLHRLAHLGMRDVRQWLGGWRRRDVVRRVGAGLPRPGRSGLLCVPFVLLLLLVLRVLRVPPMRRVRIGFLRARRTGERHGERGDGEAGPPRDADALQAMRAHATTTSRNMPASMW